MILLHKKQIVEFQLDKFQEEAIRSIYENLNV